MCSGKQQRDKVLRALKLFFVKFWSIKKDTPFNYTSEWVAKEVQKQRTKGRVPQKKIITKNHYHAENHAEKGQGKHTRGWKKQKAVFAVCSYKPGLIISHTILSF